MIRRQPRSTRTDTRFPPRRSSELRLLAVMTLQHGNGLPHGGRRQGQEKAGNQQSRTERAERRNVHDAVHLTLFWTKCKRARPSSVTGRSPMRSEEHTTELQSLMRNSYAVFCLKKKQQQRTQ